MIPRHDEVEPGVRRFFHLLIRSIPMTRKDSIRSYATSFVIGIMLGTVVFASAGFIAEWTGGGAGTGDVLVGHEPNGASDHEVEASRDARDVASVRLDGRELALAEAVAWNNCYEAGMLPADIEASVRIALCTRYPETFPAYWEAREAARVALTEDGAMEREFMDMLSQGGLVTDDEAKRAWDLIGPHLEAVAARALAPYVMAEPDGDVDAALERIGAMRAVLLVVDQMDREGFDRIVDDAVEVVMREPAGVLRTGVNRSVAAAVAWGSELAGASRTGITGIDFWVDKTQNLPAHMESLVADWWRDPAGLRHNPFGGGLIHEWVNNGLDVLSSADPADVVPGASIEVHTFDAPVPATDEHIERVDGFIDEEIDGVMSVDYVNDLEAALRVAGVGGPFSGVTSWGKEVLKPAADRKRSIVQDGQEALRRLGRAIHGFVEALRRSNSDPELPIDEEFEVVPGASSRENPAWLQVDTMAIWERTRTILREDTFPCFSSEIDPVFFPEDTEYMRALKAFLYSDAWCFVHLVAEQWWDSIQINRMVYNPPKFQPNPLANLTPDRARVASVIIDPAILAATSRPVGTGVVPFAEWLDGVSRSLRGEARYHDGLGTWTQFGYIPDLVPMPEPY